MSDDNHFDNSPFGDKAKKKDMDEEIETKLDEEFRSILSRTLASDELHKKDFDLAVSECVKYGKQLMFDDSEIIEDEGCKCVYEYNDDHHGLLVWECDKCKRENTEPLKPTK